MGFKSIVVLILVFIMIGLMFLYFIPLSTINFGTKSGNSNFSGQKSEMQFYPNMRFPDTSMSYRISNCPLQKQGDMQYAFNIIQNLTVLRFYPVDNNEQIYITCEERNRINNGMFIGGEGGPTNITVSGEFRVIEGGEILLIKQSDCPKPNIAIHELFHVLGFEHSTNQENIMYNVTSCEQTIGTDMIQLINNLYSVPSYSDLSFGNVSAVLNGRYLNANITVMNEGLANSDASLLDIYADGNFIKEISLESLKIGYGRIITTENIFVAQLSVSKLNFVINYNNNEISKDNNNLTLSINQ